AIPKRWRDQFTFRFAFEFGVMFGTPVPIPPKCALIFEHDRPRADSVRKRTFDDAAAPTTSELASQFWQLPSLTGPRGALAWFPSIRRRSRWWNSRRIKNALAYQLGSSVAADL